MKDRGLEMISLLRNVQVGQHPITWVGHSKGGLFIKQILVHGINFIYSALDGYSYVNLFLKVDTSIILLQRMKTSKPTIS